MSSLRRAAAYRPTRPETAVFVSGVASMGLEILAGRLIAPQFGSSIYTWGTIIGVFLAALSYGYWRGGKAAAERASLGRLSRLFTLTAAYVVVLVVAGDLLLRSTTAFPLPSRMASLPAVAVLFGPPTYLLGYVSPYAAQLSEKRETGAASGHVYAVGTIGSIVGAFATTYFLIPSLDTDLIALVFGLLSVATAVALAYPVRIRGEAGKALLVGLLLVAAPVAGTAGITVEGRVVYETETAYQELQVVDAGDERTLYLDGQRHSAMDLSDPDRHVFTYTRYFHLPFLYTDDIDRVLFVGGGGFTGPKRFLDEYPNVTVDVVEIDPEVVRVAREYFRVPDSPRLNVHVGDGRQFLRDTDRTYDLIVLDAYRQDKVPFQLTTRQFMELTRERLDSDGILFANVIAAPSGPASDFYRAQYRTVRTVYPQVYTYPTVGGAFVQNIELVATANDERVPLETLRERNAAGAANIDLSAELDSHTAEAPPTDDVPVLRDDRAPVDSLLDPLVGQRYVVQRTNATNTTNTTTATATA
ncbi:spermidine synthase [Halosegnis marinus]|uniref:Polyamine aminopropyltransferase n=1 Tax=Halosegnis marinus TaxID=3034023 RepID=A0ABD5ZMC6_9EURY|nr:fused MFS/spermidine synthase [Halosegnis sp. DT85]